MLKQYLQQKLQQKLSPQQIQLIKLLEIPTINLEQRIKKELEENPILDEGKEEEEEEFKNSEEEKNNDKDKEEFSLEDYLNEEDAPSYKLASYNEKTIEAEIPFSVGSSFHDFLKTQLGLRILQEDEKNLAEYILGNIDDDGYLRREIESIVDDLAFSQNINTTDEKMYKILRLIQNFEPAGVGARDLKECLLLQINKKIFLSKEEDKEILLLARKILKVCFKEFTKKHYKKIIERLNITEIEFKNSYAEILKLNPKPGNAFSDPYNKTNYHIVPDFILIREGNELKLSLNSGNSPELKINRTYATILETYSVNKKKNKQTKQQKETISFVKQKLDAAKWFIDAIKQRHNTLNVTMKSIIEYQEKYFMEGDEKLLRPMILKNIAEITNLDVSTISRVANSKYIQTHFGILPLKFFFSEGLLTDQGEEVSTREIKKILQECLEVENKRKPLTDDKLAVILQKKGYQIARRTVAKYREQLNIPVARLRKEL